MDVSSILKHVEVKTEAINITPDRSMLPKSGKVGYTLTQAIAELVDNAIDARISEEILEIKIVIQNDFVKVEDNGIGMNRKDIENALILGRSNKVNLLGEFGIGMKAACTSLGKKFTVMSTKKDLREGYIYQYAEEKWLAEANKSDWTDALKIYEKPNPNDHGTSIEIEQLTRSINKARKPEVLKDLGNRFSPFISSNQVKIYVNQDECAPEDPELNKDGKHFFAVNASNGNKINGWYGLLMHGSNKGLYGFNTFRRGRMITTYDKFGIPSHPTVSRIIGEVHMNHVPVSSSKRGWETESDEYKEAEKLLEKEFKELVAKARLTSMEEKIDKNVKDKTEVWKQELAKAAQKEINKLGDKMQTSIKKRSKNLEDPISGIIIEKRDSALDQVHNEAKIKEERTRDPKKRQVIVSHYINIFGKRYIIKHDFASLGIEKGWKDVYHKEGDPTIEIYTNQDFPAYATTSDLPFYAALHISEALGEIIASSNEENLDKANEYKEKILRDAAQIMDEFK